MPMPVSSNSSMIYASIFQDMASKVEEQRRLSESTARFPATSLYPKKPDLGGPVNDSPTTNAWFNPREMLYFFITFL
jgi:hypothetical protein